jgi:hypothetical protein
MDYLHLWHMVDITQLHERPDRIIWHWTPDGNYSAKLAYRMLHTGSTLFLSHRFIWNTSVPLRVKIFLWLAFK